MPKRIVVCCDGTWNTPNEQTPTNVVKIARAVLPTGDDGVPQSVFYDWGVGTEKGLNRLLGGAFGDGLLRNVEDGYRFIVHNWEPGDELFIFGFSRGAYTARSIVGFIRNCGVLKRTDGDRISEAVRLYKSATFHPDSPEAKKYRADHSQETDVHFIGVWDTVGSLGIPLQGLHVLTRARYQFHDVELSGIVKNAYQALAIDEQRWPFKASVWADIDKPGQAVEQVWFSGTHKDVGGGNPEGSLADIPLTWLAQKASACGLDLDWTYLERVTKPDPMGTLHNSRTGIYRIMPSHMRTIDNGKGKNESVSDSAVERMERSGGKYAPKNLVDYLERQRSKNVSTPQ